MRSSSAAGLERMVALAAELPTALVRGFRAGRELDAPPVAGERPVFAAGMGASGVAAELARGLVEAEASAPLVVVRGADLPRAAAAPATVLLLSYSGATTEAIRAYHAAGRLGARRIVVTSGGPLADRADADGAPVLRVPAGRPPRAAVGDLLGAVLGVLDPLFPESNEARLERAATAVAEQIPRIGAPGGPAADLAKVVGDRFPFVVAERSFAALARRWKSQIEENAKRLAVFDEIPELLHNSVVGWDALRPREARRYALLLLEWSAAAPLARQADRYLLRLGRARGTAAVRVPLPPEDRLSALVHGIALGDHLSFELARRAGVDPVPIPAIDRTRAALAATDPGE